MTCLLHSIAHFFFENRHELLVGAVGSVIASIGILAVQLLIAANKRARKAKRFVGNFKMLSVTTEKPYGGTVEIKGSRCVSWLSSDVLLDVTARHASLDVEWTAVVEVLGYSGMASGFFQYANHDGGALRLMLSQDGDEITEYGTPHKHPPFTNLFQRIK
jgi:hypothetical protein